MKQFILFCLLLLAAMQVAGQAVNEDSLINVLKTKETNPANKIQLCRDIANACVYNDFDKAKVYAQQGIAIAEKENDKLNMSKLYSMLGAGYIVRTSYDSAQICMNKALDLAIKSGDAAREINALFGLGTLFQSQEKYSSALDYYLQSLKRSDEVGYVKLRCAILTNIGVMHYCLKNIERAKDYLKQAEEMDKKENDSSQRMVLYHAIANCYANEKNYKQAMDYVQKAYDLSVTFNDKRLQVQSLGNIAIYLEDGFKDHDKALEYAYKCLDLAKEIGDSRDIISSWNCISNIYRGKQKFKESEQAALKGWALDSTSMYEASNFALNITIDNISMGNKDKALDFFDKYYNLRNQYAEKSSNNALMEMETKYETEKKELRIAALEKERQLYVWLGIAGGLLAISLGLALWQTVRNERKERQLVAAKSVQDGEMGERARIADDLHDRLGGSLSAVKIELKNAENLQNVSDKLDECIKEIREITHNLMPRSLRSAGLKIALEDFAAQFPNVHFHFFGEEKRIRERLEFIIYCCANELVTNSIRYSGAKDINMQLIQGDRHVSLVVQDDGCGFDEKNVTDGIGLKNIRDRVASCNGKLDISASPGKGTETIIELRIEN